MLPVATRRVVPAAGDQFNGLPRAAWNQIRVGMAIIALDGLHVEVNPAYCEMMGFTRDELVGRPSIELAPDILSGDLAKSLNALQRGDLDHVTFESAVRHRDGNAFWINATVTLARTEQGRQFFIVSATPIGELVAQRNRLRAEEARAAEGNRRYRLLFDAISDAACVVDPAALRFIEVNDAACRLYGYSREEFLTMSPTDVSAEPEATKQTLLHLDTIEHLQYTRTHVKRDGTPFPVEITVGPFEHEGRPLAVCVVRDTTERDLAQQARDEEAARMQALLAHSSDIITVLDADGTWISSTEAGARLLGYDRDARSDAGLFPFVHPDDVTTALEAFREVVDGRRGPDDPVVLRIRSATGEWRWFETVGQNLLDVEPVGGIVLNSRDITERVEAEQALDVSDRRYRALAVNSSDLVTVVDIGSGQFTYVSPSIERLLGYRPEDVVGTNGFDLFHPDDIDRIEAAATAALGSGSTAGPLTYRARHRDGSWRWHESVLTDLTADPNVAGIVTNTRDVTDRVEAENRMVSLTARFQGILDNASDAILSLDEAQRIVMFNKAAEVTFGYRADEVLGERLSMLVPDRFRARHTGFFTGFVGEAGAHRLMNRDRPELVGLRRDGTEFPAEITISKLEIDGQMLLTAIVRDVTARREAAEALQRSRQELANVLRGATETSIVATTLSGAITVFNHGAERMLGYEAGEMMGRSPLVFHDAAEIEARAAELGVVAGFEAIVTFAEHGEAETREWTFVRRDGSRVPVSLTVTAVREEDGAISGYLGVAIDLTARKVAEQRFQAAFDRAPAAMAIVDLDGRYIQANDTTGAMLGLPAGEVVGRNWLDFVHPDDAERVATSGLRIALGEIESAPDEIRIVRADGSMIWAYGDAALLRDANGAPLYLLGLMADITARKQLEEQLEHEATHDPLTGLPNRLLFRRLAEQAAARASRHGSRLGLVYLDLDGFKRVNDTFGHSAGDELLVRVAERLRGSIRAEDTVARFGGDEFALLCADSPGGDDAHRIALRCIDALAVPFRIGMHEVHVGASAGVAVHDGRGCEVDGLLDQADAALYRAKANGKGRVELAA
jgi:diguanylate cyclase (GGDEF)-like protein/PAS domain S-box-containing protein